MQSGIALYSYSRVIRNNTSQRGPQRREERNAGSAREGRECKSMIRKMQISRVLIFPRSRQRRSITLFAGLYNAPGKFESTAKQNTGEYTLNPSHNYS